MGKVLRTTELPDYVHPEALLVPDWDGVPTWFKTPSPGVFVLRVPDESFATIETLLSARPGLPTIEEAHTGISPVHGSLIIVAQSPPGIVPTCSAYQIGEWHSEADAPQSG